MGKTEVRVGIDLGGTKIEALALDLTGKELLRQRVPTPQNDYKGIIDAISGLVLEFEKKLNATATVGIGIPGTIPADTGLVKNANTICLNGNPLDKDLGKVLEREVRVANDANCLAVSEATDGSAAGYGVVFAVILGTGVGGGVAVHGKVHNGPNGCGGEWGHNPLPWMTADEYPGPACYCGKSGCIESFVSGTGFSADYSRVTGNPLKGPEIVELMEKGDAAALAAFDRYEERLARALGSLVNLLDPDCIVLGGGMSRNERIYTNVPKLVQAHVFGKHCTTPILPAKHGDSSGVRGAAWLWPMK